MRFSNRAAFLKAVKSAAPDHLSRVYCVALSSPFERAQIIDQVLHYVATPDRSLERFHGGEWDRRRFYEHLSTGGLFGGEPVALLDNGELLAKGAQQELFARPFTFGYLVLGVQAKTPLIGWAEKEGVVLDGLEEKPWDKEKRLLDEIGARAANAGKALLPDAAALLLERVERDAAILASEVEKLICYVGERHSITTGDVLAVSATRHTASPWQIAEELVWEGAPLKGEGVEFFALAPALRAQLQIGLKIATLIEQGAGREAWQEALPKVYPKTLEKRSAQAVRLGKSYFIAGLQFLLELELMSRSGEHRRPEMFADLFCVWSRGALARPHS
jgi:DNA polymerase-3 subunit delta